MMHFIFSTIGTIVKMCKPFILISLLIGVSCLSLTACTSQSRYRYVSPRSNAYDALAEAAVSVRQSLTDLGEIEQAAYPPQSVAEVPDPSTYGMNIPTSIDWDGPIQPLAQQIANAANYKLRVLGRRPSIPVIVSVSAHNEPLGDILRDVGYQSKNRAQIVVFPSTHVIELRYKGV
jgi:defect-in-organelle-trafficking protein DotD